MRKKWIMLSSAMIGMSILLLTNQQGVKAATTEEMTIAYQKHLADEKIAQEVVHYVAKLYKFKYEVTDIIDEEKVSSAREMYTNLTPSQMAIAKKNGASFMLRQCEERVQIQQEANVFKAYVDSIDINSYRALGQLNQAYSDFVQLSSAAEELAEASYEQAKAMEVTVNQNRVKRVENLIIEAGTDESLVWKARQQYSILTDKQKEMFNPDFVTKLEKAEAQIKFEEPIHQFESVADELYMFIEDGDYQERVKEARQYYNALTSEQKAVAKKSYKKLLTNEQTVKDQKAAANVDKAIRNIRFSTSKNYKSTVKKVRSQYDKLTKAQKKFLIYKEVLTDHEKTIDMRAAGDVANDMEKINRRSSKAQIKKVNTAYKKLTTKQKKYIPKKTYQHFKTFLK
ncbi:hypothetical protein [Rummeliibacillus sp. POC4]|uniref:hypothetical protein n=1 Tax=Rummeliibacillus sp. POC4 TaxID=2305899 RepID=UPI000E664DF3|nr:hypothetical protein [Rummeliibacillus sp. POC4]RIJ65641.1 hypothetical protein D1606_07800 [Rummeliibacillus sp. POC4]